MPSLLDLLRNPAQDDSGQPDYATTAANLNTQEWHPPQIPPGMTPVPYAPTPTPAISQPSALQQASAPAPQPAPPSNPVADAIAKKYGFSQASDQDAMQDAMGVANNNKLFANLGGALNTITHGIAGSQKPVDNSAFQQAAQDSDTPVKNVLALRKGEQDDAAYQRQQMLQDPNSVMASVLRKQYAPLAKQVGLDPKSLDGMGVQDLNDFAQKPLDFAAKLKESQQSHKDALEMRRITLQSQLDEKDTKHQTDALTQLQHDKTYQKQRDTAETADNLINKIDLARTNPQAANALSTELALFLSEGQRLHGATIEAMSGGSKALLPSLTQGIQKKWDGTITDDNAKAAQELVGAIKQGAEQTKARLEQQAAGNYKKVHGKDPNWAPTAMQTSLKNSTSQDQEAVAWAKANASDPRAQQILKLNGVQ